MAKKTPAKAEVAIERAKLKAKQKKMVLRVWYVGNKLRQRMEVAE